MPENISYLTRIKEQETGMLPQRHGRGFHRHYDVLQSLEMIVIIMYIFMCVRAHMLPFVCLIFY